MPSTPDIIGIIGIVFILFAYFLLQVNKLKPQNVWYSILNGLGALLILVSLIYDFNLPSFIIEIAWILISIYGIAKHFKTKKRS